MYLRGSAHCNLQVHVYTNACAGFIVEGHKLSVSERYVDTFPVLFDSNKC